MVSKSHIENRFFHLIVFFQSKLDNSQHTKLIDLQFMYVYGYEELAESNFCFSHQIVPMGAFTLDTSQLPLFTYMFGVR